MQRTQVVDQWSDGSKVSCNGHNWWTSPWERRIQALLQWTQVVDQRSNGSKVSCTDTSGGSAERWILVTLQRTHVVDQRSDGSKVRCNGHKWWTRGVMDPWLVSCNGHNCWTSPGERRIQALLQWTQVVDQRSDRSKVRCNEHKW